MQALVLGASRVGLSLIHRLLEKSWEVSLVDPDAELFVNKHHLDIRATDGVIIDQDILREGNIEEMDAVFAVSESENQNLMASQIACDIFNVKQVITRVYQSDDYHLFDDYGFVSISSPDLTVDAIINALEDDTSKNDEVGSCLSNVFGHDIEFTLVDLSNDFVGAKIREVEDTDGRHIFAIVRHEHFILSLPTTKLEKGDKLVLATKKS
ncbi:MAG TPA: NAD-binding protein [Bacillota bacterium]|nr:NAD-binding protein [Bacillota bacterium]